MEDFKAQKLTNVWSGRGKRGRPIYVHSTAWLHRQSIKKTKKEEKKLFSGHNSYPTGPFTILEPQHQETGKLYVVQKRRAADFGIFEIVE